MKKQQNKAEIEEKRIAGRQRTVWPVFGSMAQASAVMGYPQSVLKMAKERGCKAFIQAGRVDSGPLIPFINQMLAKGSELPDGIATPQDWLATEKAKRESIKRQVDERLVMPTADAQNQAAEACQFFFSELERWERESPPALAGQTAVEVFKRQHGFTEQLRKNAKKKFEEIGK